ncbi:hypothetical protein D3C71_1798470 [compost metagenome]
MLTVTVSPALAFSSPPISPLPAAPATLKSSALIRSPNTENMRPERTPSSTPLIPVYWFSIQT